MLCSHRAMSFVVLVRFALASWGSAAKLGGPSLALSKVQGMCMSGRPVRLQKLWSFYKSVALM